WFTEQGIDRVATMTPTGGTIAEPPTIGKSFGALSIDVCDATSLTFTLENPNPAMALTGVGFVDVLPSGLVVSTPNGLAGGCGGGIVTATAGSATVTLSGATLGANVTCVITLNVTAT